MKVNDVYKIKYTDKYKKTQSPHKDFSHCFEGFAVVKMSNDEEMVLYDTFWGIGRRGGKSFKLGDIGIKIDIEYYCNLDEVEKASSDDEAYYDDKDLYIITDQHGCVPRCVHYFKTIGANKSIEKMKKSIESKILNLESTIKSSQYKIDRQKLYLKQLDSGDLDNIWI